MTDKKLTVLVVGGAGYIGSHITKMLLEEGHKAIILDNLSTGHKQLILGGEFVLGDLGDVSLLDRIFQQYRIDAVMHFAAFSLVGESVVAPMKYYENNVVATSVLLAAMIRHKVRHFIFSSTAAVYGEPETIPMSEKHPCKPTNPYGATKLTVERMLQDYASAYDLNYTNLRYFNASGADPSGTIGEMHDPESHLIPLLLKWAKGELKEMKIFGDDYDTSDGTCIRDYVHVNDLARAHLLALEKSISDNTPSIYNLGNSTGHSVYEVLETVRKVTGQPLPVTIAPRRKGDPAVLVADSRKARTELGWRPQFEDLEEIVRTAWNWERNR